MSYKASGCVRDSSLRHNFLTYRVLIQLSKMLMPVARLFIFALCVLPLSMNVLAAPLEAGDGLIARGTFSAGFSQISDLYSMYDIG